MTKQKDELAIHIRQDGTIIVDNCSNGHVSTKCISLDDLVGSIKGSLKTEMISVSSGLLPQKCISYQYAVESEKSFVVLDFDVGHANVTYMKTDYPDFPLPRLVFGFKLNEKRHVYNVYLGVPANEKLSENTPMYIYPFSNVDGFHLCTGINQLPTVKSLTQLSNTPHFILSLPNNNDRYNERHNALRLGHRELMEHLKDKDTDYYYDKVLIPMPSKTLKNFLDSGC